jgi:PilZ domain
MMPVVDNRASSRNLAIDNIAYVHIMQWAGKSITRARLLDISTGGALISTYTLMAIGEKVRVQFDRAPEIGWLEAEVVHVKRPRKVGIRFNRPLRPEFANAPIRECPQVADASEEETAYIDPDITMDCAR